MNKSITLRSPIALWVFFSITALALFFIESVQLSYAATDCSITQSDSAYGSRFNVLFQKPSQSLLGVNCSGTTATAVAGNGDVGGDGKHTIIYKQGYESVRLGGSWIWKPITYSGARVSADNVWDNWVYGTAEATLTASPGGNPGTVLAYICQLKDNIWKCGCSDTSCTGQTKYTMVKFTPPSSLPPTQAQGDREQKNGTLYETGGTDNYDFLYLGGAFDKNRQLLTDNGGGIEMESQFTWKGGSFDSQKKVAGNALVAFTQDQTQNFYNSSRQQERQKLYNFGAGAMYGDEGFSIMLWDVTGKKSSIWSLPGNLCGAYVQKSGSPQLCLEKVKFEDIPADRSKNFMSTKLFGDNEVVFGSTYGIKISIVPIGNGMASLRAEHYRQKYDKVTLVQVGQVVFSISHYFPREEKLRGVVARTPGEADVNYLASAISDSQATNSGAEPTINLSAAPSAITKGGSATLTWSSTNASTCTGAGFSSGNKTAGTASVTPTQTTTYSVACSGAGGTVSKSETISVSSQTINSAPKYNIVYKTTTVPTYGMLDVFPASSSEKKPVVLYIHPGGWSAGDKADETSSRIVNSLRNTGYAVVSMNYGLVPRYKYQTQMEDVDCALRWITKNATAYNFDTNTVHMMGVSAGGHMALLSTLNPQGFGAGSGCLSTEYARPQVKKVVSYEGLTDLTASFSSYTNSLINAFLPSSSYKAAASPITYVKDAGALGISFLLVHGTGDTIVPFTQASSLYTALQNSGTRVSNYWVNGADHDLAYASHSQWNNAMAAVKNFLTMDTASPVITFTASPSTVTQGGSATLQWSSTNASTCTGTGFSSGNKTAGTTSVTPTQTTTYSVACSGAGGTVSKSVLVTMSQTPLSANEYSGNLYTNGSSGFDFYYPGGVFDKSKTTLTTPGGSITMGSRFTWSGTGSIATDEHALVAFTQDQTQSFYNSPKQPVRQKLFNYGAGALVRKDGLVLELWNVPALNTIIWHQAKPCGEYVQKTGNPNTCLSKISLSQAQTGTYDSYITTYSTNSITKGQPYEVKLTLTYKESDWIQMHAELYKGGTLVQMAQANFRVNSFLPTTGTLRGTVGRTPGSANIAVTATSGS